MIEILAITSYWNFVVPAVSVILPMYVLIVVISFCISVETRSCFFFSAGPGGVRMSLKSGGAVTAGRCAVL